MLELEASVALLTAANAARFVQGVVLPLRGFLSLQLTNKNGLYFTSASSISSAEAEASLDRVLALRRSLRG